MFSRMLRAFASLVLVFAFLSADVAAQEAVIQQPPAKESAPVYLDQKTLLEFYDKRAGTVWLRGITTFQPRAEGALGVLGQSWSHGLNPDKYHVPRLKALMAQGPSMNRSEFDMLLTDGIVRYARDISGNRIGNKGSSEGGKYWREPLTVQQILDQVVDAANPIAALNELAPQSKLYNALHQELIALAANADEPFEQIETGASLKPQDKNAAVPFIRARLGLEPAKSHAEVYDDETAAQVMKLQRRNAIKPDGVIGPATLALLNRGPKQKMEQIVANMERLRGIEEKRPDRYIIVNIPSASLWAVEKGDIAIEMPVVVGKEGRQTNSFRTEISGVRFNPTWTVPPTIKREDLLPLLQSKPERFLERGIRITLNGAEVDPMTTDWSKVTPGTVGKYNMVERPGVENPLGRIRVLMENPYNIYLHDTNHREAFATDERSLSSGCIRVAEPERLANFILKSNKGWSWQRMLDIIDTGKTRDISAEEKMPVYIAYQTVWLDSEGHLIYGKDIYGQDAKLVQDIEKTDGIHIPEKIEQPQISL
ncbi:MAG: murein L,D-transpeptidase [Micavibrio aeruginosavorus]|uniref:Murein L,D-transpeptidase n=1 Tax=Micavibrio aeruginosavorus TaxID=349221 RepID=A0A2W5A0X2_9BACT|nr:MAG: murein L,D-transpeptidase [Micavibrio aeruginosavorus]